MFLRKQIFNGAGDESLFLWGPRQTGKSTMLKFRYPDAIYFDLLLSEVYERFRRDPSNMRETILASPGNKLVIIDEIQRIPELLNEVHWLMVNHSFRFILSGSSPRKIVRGGANLLGGRALRQELFPLIFQEIPGFDLARALNRGLLPRHYLSDKPELLIAAYIGSYLHDEIASEARLRRLSSFTRFLEVAAFSNGEILNFTNIASDCGVSGPTVREYFQILEETMIGRLLPSFQKRSQRRLVQAPKFYYFDPGIANYLLKRRLIEPGSEAFGRTFEHYIYHELYAHSHYSGLNYPLSYWRTSSGTEVDFILGDHQAAVEVKGTDQVQPRHLKGLIRFAEDYPTGKKIVVSNDPMPRRINDVHVLPWKIFLEQLWAGNIIS